MANHQEALSPEQEAALPFHATADTIYELVFDTLRVNGYKLEVPGKGNWPVCDAIASLANALADHPFNQAKVAQMIANENKRIAEERENK